MTSQAPTRSKARMVYETLRSRIVRGTYTPGYRLVLSTLASELEVSAVPVREAVRQLQSEGLVEYTRNIGFEVSGIDVDEYHDSMESLALLEGSATALAAPLLGTDRLVEAQGLNEEMQRMTRSGFDSDTYRRLNNRFHTVLTDACPNQRLLGLLRTEAERVAMIRRSSLAFSPTLSTTSIHQHARLLELIRTGAPAEEIERAAREHKLASMRSHLAQRSAA